MMGQGEVGAVIDIAGKIENLGLRALLILVLIGGYYGVWVYGKVHRARDAEWQKRYEERDAEWAKRLAEKTKECEEWKSAFLRVAQHTDKALDLAVKPPGVVS